MEKARNELEDQLESFKSVRDELRKTVDDKNREEVVYSRMTRNELIGVADRVDTIEQMNKK